MRITGMAGGLVVGALAGALVVALTVQPTKFVVASGNDRYGDYAMATGAVSVNPRVPMDGVWMLDYRSGKLLGTVIDKTQGKIAGWAEVDLVTEFAVTPKQDVHFMMVTGWVSQGQSALYVAETSTGKFGVYTMTAGADGGVQVKRHDMTSFRQTAPAPAAIPPAGEAVPPKPVTFAP